MSKCVCLFKLSNVINMYCTYHLSDGHLPSLVLSQPLLGQVMVDLLHLTPGVADQNRTYEIYLNLIHILHIITIYYTFGKPVGSHFGFRAAPCWNLLVTCACDLVPMDPNGENSQYRCLQQGTVQNSTLVPHGAHHSEDEIAHQGHPNDLIATSRHAEFRKRPSEGPFVGVHLKRQANFVRSISEQTVFLNKIFIDIVQVYSSIHQDSSSTGRWVPNSQNDEDVMRQICSQTSVLPANAAATEESGMDRTKHI